MAGPWEAFAETPRATQRGFTVDDVGASMRGDLFNEPGLPISYGARPGQQFGVQATANAQPFHGIVAHHTGSETLSSALNTARRGDPFRSGVNYGYHFYIDKDGSITQGAPMDARTNHVKSGMSAQRTGRPDLDNSNAIGISFVGTGGAPTREQQAAAENLSRSLMQRYGIQTQNVVGHGEVQNDRQTGEGMPLVNAIRNGGQPVQVANAAPVMSDAPFVPQQPDVAPPVAQRPDSRADQIQIMRPDSLADKPADGPWTAFAKPQKPDIGRGKALLEGLRSGATANFGDEIAGVAAASGLPGWVPDPVRLAAGVVRAPFQPNEARAAYEARRDEVRADQRASQDQYPGTYIAGNVAGAIALPGGAALQAATMPARIARGAAVGAAYGGASGVGEGESLSDRAIRGATGAAAGAAVGAAAPPVLAGVEALGRGINNAVIRPVTDRIRGAIDPERAAARNIVESIRSDTRAGLSEMAPAEWRAAQQAGVPVSIAELGGERTRALARSAANLSPEGRAALQNIADSRFEGQSDRAVTYLKNIFGFSGDTAATREALEAQARRVNSPAYRKAYSDPRAQGLWDEGFEQIAQAPVVQNAIRAASVTAANRGTAEGLPRIQSPFIVDRVTGQLTLRTDANGNRVLPNLQFWDHVKRNLDKIGTPEARTLNGALKAHLDELVPSYKPARAGAARFFDADEALTAGENFVHKNMAIGEAMRALASMSPAERELFKQGFAARLIDDISRTSDRVNIANKIGATKDARTKVEMVLGPRTSNTLAAMMSVEQSIDKLRQALGNSTSVRQYIEMGLAGTSAGYGVATNDPTQLAVIAAIGGRRWVDQRVARKVAEMLTSSDPAVLAKGIKAVQSNQALSKAFRDFDTRLARVGSGQTPVAQMPGAVRAEDQESVPRMPSQ
jgi:hypothetical protein